MRQTTEDIAKGNWLEDIMNERALVDPAYAAMRKEAAQQAILVQARRESGLTQAQVAEAMGVKQPRIAEIERHPSRVSFGVLSRYAEVVGKRIVFESAAPYETADGDS